MKKILLLFFCLMAMTNLIAKDRSDAEMQAIALQKLRSVNAAKGKNNKVAKLVCLKSADRYNIYGIKDQAGFAIIAKDNAFDGLLGYSSSTFNESVVPDGFSWWIAAVDKVMNQYASGKISLPQRGNYAKTSYPVVEPFITTKWGQGAPYNRRVPKINEENAPAGCVAIALSQVMNYNQYPASASFRGYCYVNNQLDSMDINSTYSWPYKDTYTATEMAGNRVASLIRDCGYAVYMNYASDGSGAASFLAPYALVHTFGYPAEAVKYMSREYYTEDEWRTKIYEEISKGYPVIYAGVDESAGGHEFIFHGIDENGLVYVNWGWDGSYDGYYDFDVLQVSGNKFSASQDMAVGLRKSALSTDEIEPQFVTDTVYTFKYDNANDSLTIAFNQPVYNMSVSDFVGRFCMAFNDSVNNNIQYLDLIEPNDTIGAGYGFDAQEFGGDIRDAISMQPGHSYGIYLVAQLNNENTWYPIRTIGGPISYTLTVDNDGKIYINNPYAETTGIKKVYNRSAYNIKSDKWYTIDGKEISSGSGHGILINNGKKFIKK